MKDEIRRVRCDYPREIYLHILVITADRFTRTSCISVHYRAAPACHNVDSVTGYAARSRCQEVDGYVLGIAV